MESGRNLTEQVLELVGDVATGVVPGGVSGQFVGFLVLLQLLRRPLLDNPADLPAAGIVLDADAHVSESFPAHVGEALLRELAGLVADEFGFRIAGVESVSNHGQYSLSETWGRDAPSRVTLIKYQDHSYIFQCGAEKLL